MSRKSPASLEELLRGGSLQEPPRDVLHRALALKLLLPKAQPTLAGWIVSLVFDSGLQPVPAGLRSGGSSERRLLYEAREGADDATLRQVDVRVRREAAGTIEVLGQCLPPLEAAQAQARAGRSRRVARVDESGEFLVRGLAVKGDSFELALLVGGRPVLELGSVPVPAPAARA